MHIRLAYARENGNLGPMTKLTYNLDMGLRRRTAAIGHYKQEFGRDLWDWGEHTFSLTDSDADSLTKRSIITTDKPVPPAEIQMLVITGKLPEMMGPTVYASEIPARFRLNAVALLSGLIRSET